MSAVVDVLRIDGIRRLELAWVGGVSAKYGAVVALSVYAYGAGGAGAVALYGVVRTVPGLVLCPVIISRSAGMRRERLLLGSLALRALALLLSAAGIAAGVPLLAVLLLAGLESGLVGVHRPVQAALLPWLARTPEELTAANVLSSLLGGTAVFVGPVLVGAVLAWAGPGAAVGATAVLLAGSFAALLRLRVHQPAAPPWLAGSLHRQVLDDLRVGLQAYRRTRGMTTLLLLFFAQTVVRGALTVLLVVLAVDALEVGEPGVAWLNGAMGVGGFGGGFVAVRLIRGRWLAQGLALGVAGWGMFLGCLSLVGSLPLALMLLGLVGGSHAVLEVATFTAVQRALPADAIGPALVVLEAVVLVALGLGSALAAPLVSGAGVHGTFLAVGVFLLGVAAAGWRALVQVDRDVVEPGPEVARLRRLAIFAPLPLLTVEHLATRLHQHDYEDGAVVIRAGDPGDAFHLIVAGEAVASAAGSPLRTMGPGDGFGEIALMRDVPRTATVMAHGPLCTASLDRADFLGALAASPLSATEAEALADSRLAAGGATDHRAR